MSQKVQMTQDMKNGTLETSGKKRGRPPKADKEVEVRKNPIPDNVLVDPGKLEWATSRARSSGAMEILVSPDIIHGLLLEKYDNDPMMIYKNVMLYDYKQVEEAKKSLNTSVNERIFGQSKVKMGSNSRINTPNAES